jgi:hypothetical protein
MQNHASRIFHVSRALLTVFMTITGRQILELGKSACAYSKLPSSLSF